MRGERTGRGTDSPRYIFDNAAPQARDRLAGLAELYDPVTMRHLDTLGIEPGWCCLEVGAGSGSVALMMSERVGSSGHVLATDINTDWLPSTVPTNVEVRRHDIAADPLTAGSFDLIHARAVLPFVADYPATLARLVAALRPGGWLLVEELLPVASELAGSRESSDAMVIRRWRLAVFELMRIRGGDPTSTHHLPARLGAAGLVDVGVEGFFNLTRTPAAVRLTLANVDQVGADLVEGGLLTTADLDRYRAVIEGPDIQPLSWMALVSAWGRRPTCTEDRS